MGKTATAKWVMIATIGFVAAAVSACAPEVGSKKWCEKMKAKPQGEWSLNEAADFAKNCIFPKDE